MRFKSSSPRKREVAELIMKKNNLSKTLKVELNHPPAPLLRELLTKNLTSKAKNFLEQEQEQEPEQDPQQELEQKQELEQEQSLQFSNDEDSDVMDCPSEQPSTSKGVSEMRVKDVKSPSSVLIDSKDLSKKLGDFDMIYVRKSGKATNIVGNSVFIPLRQRCLSKVLLENLDEKMQFHEASSPHGVYEKYINSCFMGSHMINHISPFVINQLYREEDPRVEPKFFSIFRWECLARLEKVLQIRLVLILRFKSKNRWYKIRDGRVYDLITGRVDVPCFRYLICIAKPIEQSSMFEVKDYNELGFNNILAEIDILNRYIEKKSFSSCKVKDLSCLLGCSLPHYCSSDCNTLLSVCYDLQNIYNNSQECQQKWKKIFLLIHVGCTSKVKHEKQSQLSSAIYRKVGYAENQTLNSQTISSDEIRCIGISVDQYFYILPTEKVIDFFTTPAEYLEFGAPHTKGQLEYYLADLLKEGMDSTVWINNQVSDPVYFLNTSVSENVNDKFAGTNTEIERENGKDEQSANSNENSELVVDARSSETSESVNYSISRPSQTQLPSANPIATYQSASSQGSLVTPNQEGISYLVKQPVHNYVTSQIVHPRRNVPFVEIQTPLISNVEPQTQSSIQNMQTAFIPSQSLTGSLYQLSTPIQYGYSFSQPLYSQNQPLPNVESSFRYQ